MAILPEPIRNPHEEITLQEAKGFLATGAWGDEASLALVVQDTQRAEAEENRRQFILGWVEARTLYSSVFTPRYWPGTQSEAASINFFTVACAVNGIDPQVLAGLFYENPP